MFSLMLGASEFLYQGFVSSTNPQINMLRKTFSQASAREQIYLRSAYLSTLQQWSFCAWMLTLISVDLHMRVAILCLIATKIQSVWVREQLVLHNHYNYGETIIAVLTKVCNGGVSVCICAHILSWGFTCPWRIQDTFKSWMIAKLRIWSLSTFDRYKCRHTVLCKMIITYYRLEPTFRN